MRRPAIAAKLSGIAVAAVAFLAQPANAGGFSEAYQFAAGPGSANASAGGVWAFENANGAYSSSIHANASVQETANGFTPSGSADGYAVASTAQGSVTTSSGSGSTSFTKGGNAIAKSRTETLTKITVNGRTYLVAQEIAIAVARGSQFGVSAAAASESTLPGNAYSQAQVISTKGAR